MRARIVHSAQYAGRMPLPSSRGASARALARFLRIGALALAVVLVQPAQAAGALAERPAVKAFIQTMVARHDFSQEKLEALFREVELRPDIIRAISQPAESKPWYKYRPIFVTADRIRQGLAFWNQHEDVLKRAEQAYGVPPSIIVAILGVETRYGAHTGSYRVVDALSTLAFDYPPRADFFRGELEHYLLMAREEGFAADSRLGSYAGAMGQPQFIPSSFRAYAVDFDEDGQRNLWSDTADAVGSVANYFKRHGWRSGGPIAVHVQVEGDPQPLLDKGLKPKIPVRELRAHGVALPETIDDGELGALLALETEHGHQYWVVFHNFYVITRYNHSPLYAMAVYQLGEGLGTARGEAHTASRK